MASLENVERGGRGNIPKARKRNMRVKAPAAMCFHGRNQRPAHEGRQFLCSPRTGQLHLQTNITPAEQCGTNTARIIINVVAISIDVAIVIYVRGVITIIAGGAEPPPTSSPIQLPPHSNPLYAGLNLFLSELIQAPVRRSTSVVSLEIISNCFMVSAFDSIAS